MTYETRCKMCKSSCHEVVSEIFAMNAPDPPHWTLNSCFGAFVQFWCILDRLVDLRNLVQNGPNWCKSSCHEVLSEFFATNAPVPPHWTLNACLGHFVQFWCIWDRLDDLRNSVQKFVPQSWVRNFRNERTRSTPLDPKLMFWCVRTIFVHLGPFG
jgi:hypothetical protein